MKTLIFKADINDENIFNLIHSIEEIEDGVKIYFSSEGGTDVAANMFIDYINNSEKEITLVLYSYLHSASLDIAMSVNCKIKVLDGCYSIAHLYGMPLHTREDHKVKGFYQKYLDRLNNRLIKMYSNYFTEEEIEKIKNQEDVYLCDERLRLIFS